VESEIAILMADLTGYTAMTHVHGGASAAKIVKKYMQLVDSALVGSSKVIQRIGDQVVITSFSANDILGTSQQLVKIASDEHQFLSVHAGLHYGPVFIEGDSLFGSTINIASRIMNLALRDQVLCSTAFLNQLSEKESFRSCGSHKLKNVIEEFDLYQLVHEARPTFFIDPVCHMQIDPLKGDRMLRIDKTTYHFCSDHCRNLFQSSPEAFIADM
jgi:adenylate cyclase